MFEAVTLGNPFKGCNILGIEILDFQSILAFEGDEALLKPARMFDDLIEIV